MTFTQFYQHVRDDLERFTKVEGGTFDFPYHYAIDAIVVFRLWQALCPHISYAVINSIFMENYYRSSFEQMIENIMLYSGEDAL